MTLGSLFDTGIRPVIDAYLLKQSQARRDYGEYWPASSAGYCMRKTTFDRMQVPFTLEDARKQRVFTAGNVFHAWIQDITKTAGLSIAQEAELIDDEIMVKGHFDDLVVVKDGKLILYDYKTQNSRAFTWSKDRGMSHYHKMQLGTYMYMLRKVNPAFAENGEARILKISKDDLRMSEERLAWSPALENSVVAHWTLLNRYWENGTIPDCTCADQENGFMAKAKYNPYWFNDEPCSLDWLAQCQERGLV